MFKLSLVHLLFEWDEKKNRLNQLKHGVSFTQARKAFEDKRRVIAEDLEHGGGEKRFFCFGKVNERVLTVRFTFRLNFIRIFGAGYWRKGKKYYEKENDLH